MPRMTRRTTCQIGDMVRIIECAPISKRKTWTVVERNGSTVEGAAADAVAAAEPQRRQRPAARGLRDR